MKKPIIIGAILSLMVCNCCRPLSENIISSVIIPNTPVLSLKQTNEIAQINLVNNTDKKYNINTLEFDIEGTENLKDIDIISISDTDMEISSQPIAIAKKLKSKIKFKLNIPVITDTFKLCINIKLRDTIDLSNKISIGNISLYTSDGKVISNCTPIKKLRVGIALRQEMQDNIHTSRIPGITTSKNGALIAIYDGRRDSDRDLQGDIDICYNRSTDGGKTWSPVQVAIDMGKYGGLPEKYNGVSDGCILSDDRTGDLYIIGLWMHGILDPKNGKWVQGLTENSTAWNHQWRSFGSQPGYDIKRSSQFLIVKSTDDGLTWSEPINITEQVKPEDWWLMAPAPGHGITLDDGTLVFPAEGRMGDGLQISTIIYSKDGGAKWKTGNPAYTNTNECMAVQLSDGSIMLNMRERSNRSREDKNGRAITVTKDTADTWTEHSTSRCALIESACQASIHKHIYIDKSGNEQQLLLFFNPSSKYKRDNFTLKCSLDDGSTWPEAMWLTLDEKNGNGYSCITSIDDETIGILYEGSGANLVFQQIKISEILEKYYK